MKKYILPAAAAVLVIAAALVVTLVPKGQKSAGGVRYAQTDENGDVLVKAADLSETDVTFIRLSKDSKVELLALRGEDGSANVALGTCQSCNGSPGAYYTQEGDVLKCNNCGLTFPLTVIEEPGGGCHPIMLGEDGVQQTEEGVVLSAKLLDAYAPLFEKVADH